VARAIETGETEGIMKAIVDSDTGQILGCAILGNEGGEVMSMIEIAMMAKLPYTALRDGVFAHPLYAESLNSLFTRISS
jgi:pyruvate/2-oxoglutarate dehydrogenase complex dihydrolipoamide dehydrogenase (E3) component